MRYGDRLYPATLAQRCDRPFVDQRQTIPKNVSLARLHQQGALTNRKMRFHANAQKIGLLLFSHGLVCAGESFQVSPLLPRRTYILAFIEADRTFCGRRRGGRKLSSAGCANERRHDCPRSPDCVD